MSNHRIIPRTRQRDPGKITRDFNITIKINVGIKRPAWIKLLDMNRIEFLVFWFIIWIVVAKDGRLTPPVEDLFVDGCEIDEGVVDI